MVSGVADALRQKDIARLKLARAMGCGDALVLLFNKQTSF